jgi:hypothetical protein
MRPEGLPESSPKIEGFILLLKHGLAFISIPPLFQLITYCLARSENLIAKK